MCECVGHRSHQMEAGFNNSNTQQRHEEGKMKAMSESESEPKNMSKWARYRMMGAMTLLHFCGHLAFSLMAPTFPPKAKERGISNTVIGAVLAVYQLSVVLMSFCNGFLVSRIGAKQMQLVGSILCAATVGVFGILLEIPDNTAFIAACMVCRILEAMGSSLIVISNFTIVTELFMEDVATFTALLQGGYSMAVIAGPSLGGGLYELGGYQCPFISVGALILFSGGLGLFLTPNVQAKQSDTTVSVWRVFKIVGVSCSVLGAIQSGLMLSLLEPVLSVHLITNFGLTISTASLVFISSAGSLLLICPLATWLVKKGFLLSTMSAGLLLAGLSLIVVSPDVLTGLKGSLTSVIIGLVIQGAGNGLAIVPPFTAMLSFVYRSGSFKKTMAFTGKLQGIMSASFAFGSFVGPQSSGLLTDFYGFEVATTILGLSSCIVSGVILLVLFTCHKQEAGYQHAEDTPHDTVKISKINSDSAISSFTTDNNINRR